MDNISKVFIIAGAIIIVMTVIGIAIIVLSKGERLGNVAIEQMDAIEIQNHNSKFDRFLSKGTCTGAEVKECISMTLAVNEKADSAETTVSITIDNGSGPIFYVKNIKDKNGRQDIVDDLSANVLNSDKYTVTKGDTQGLITSINFEKK